MSLKSDIQSLSEIIEKIEIERKKSKDSSGDLFGGLKVITKAFPSAKLVFDKQKFRQYFAQPYNFLHIVKFLDVNNILNVGLINKEFNVFINSIYMYKVIFSSKHRKSNNARSKSPKSVSSSTSSKSNKSTSSPKKNYVGGLLKNVGNFFFGNKDVRKVNMNEISMKISLHEEILLKMKKRYEIEMDTKNIREEIDSILYMKKPKNYKKSNESNQSNNEYLEINREVIQKEHNSLEKEVAAIKIEIDKLKRKIEYLEINDIEKAKSLSSIKSYLSNNIKSENLMLFQDKELKSGKFPNLDDFDTSCLAFYDEFLKQD